MSEQNTDFDPSRYEGKPRFFGGPGRKLLDSFWAPMVGRLDRMTQDELKDLISACRHVSPINCGWYTYRIADLLHDIAAARICDSDGSPKGRDAKRLDGEAATARAGGIAHPGGSND